MKRTIFSFILLFSMMILVSCVGTKNNVQEHNALEHQFNIENIVNEATCETDGLKRILCECGAYIEETIPKSGHHFEWKIEKDATCDETGLEIQTCLCGETGDSRVISATSHHYQWTTKEEATCHTKELLEGKCACGDTIIKENSVLAHLYGEFEVLEESSTTKEGLIETICANGCGEDIRLKVMKTPNVVRNIGTLSWNAVDEAVGYKLYDNGQFILDLGNVLSYEVNLCESTNHSYEVEAYTDNDLYYETSSKSIACAFSVTHGSNMQASLGTNFERFNKSDSIILTTEFIKNYANFSTGEVTIIKENNNAVAKLLHSENNGYVAFTHESNPEVLKAGTYIISMDVKLGTAADGKLSFGFYDGVAWAPASRTLIDISNANSSSWVTVSYEFTISSDKTGEYANLDIGYQGIMASENNYILIDNIKLILKGTNANLNENRNYDFETSFSNLLTTAGWVSDGYNGVVYVSDDSLENSIVNIDGNMAFKAYTSSFKTASANFKGNKKIATEGGVYMLTIKVKGGPDANRLGSIGFRMFGENSFKVVDVRFDGVEQINDEEWVTLKAIFIVKKPVTTTWVNIEIYTYTNNDENSSVDNYVLIDDLSVYQVYIQ